MTTRIAVVIATRNRPQLLSSLLERLKQQTVRPDAVVVSACNADDIEPGVAESTKVLFGPPGLTAQRNRALSAVRGKHDIIIFFDDDFVPSRFWIERVSRLLDTYPDVGTITGRILKDGVKSGEIDWSVGESIVDKADTVASSTTLDNHKVVDHKPPYGCNMAFRAAVIDGLQFDERLALYGWLEDRDFGFRASARSKTIQTDLVWGVHLGTLSGRTSGQRYGYSQIVNPWYLMTKGTMTPIQSLAYISRALSRNALGSLSWRSAIDRRGRLRGNLVGVKDIVLGRWAPEKIVQL